MKIFNCHSHTCFSHDGNGSIEELCVQAQEKGLLGFAVTDHCDCEYFSDQKIPELLNNSFANTDDAQKKYASSLIIARGVEIGDAIYSQEFATKIIEQNNWDVILGSVHAVRVKDWDMPFSLIDFSLFDDDFIDKYIVQYFENMLEMVVSSDFDILCHLTVVLRYIVYKYNRKVDIDKYKTLIREILQKIIKNEKTLELNTSGVYGGYFMPDANILEIYKDLGGKRITLGSDSHAPTDINNGLYEGAVLLKKLGFRHLTYYLDRIPHEYEI